MVIQHNIAAIHSNRMYGITYKNNIAMAEKLSSGYKINRSADDAAGLSISEKMRRQIRGLTQAALNAQDGISMVQTAEGALHEVQEMLQRMNQLAIQAANGTNSEADRKYLQNEVNQILGEVDRVSETTMFNEIRLLDGRYGGVGGEKREDGNDKKITGFTITYHITDAVKPHYSNHRDTKWDNTATTLQNQIVPQAVTSLLTTFSKTFSYLDGANIGIGLQMSDNSSSSTMASVKLYTAHINGTPAIVDLGYTLYVNTAFITLDSNNNLTEDSRRNLESTITHEMMHGFMMESLTAGMVGRDQSMNSVQGFPKWFVEGTAQAAGGGASDVEYRLNINGYSTESEITAALQSEALGSGSSDSLYGTGYLAVMYLGYLVSGKNSMAIADIAEGIDEIMYQVRGGKSLSEVIAETTNQRYTDLDDFETRFAQDGAAFSKELLDLAQNGFGALVGGNYTSNDILANDTITNQKLFTLYPNHDVVYNEYKEGYNFLEGGLAEAQGIAGAGHPNYSASPGGNQGGTTPGGGNTGGGTNTGGGGNQGTVVPGGTEKPIIIKGSSSRAMVNGKRIGLQIGSDAGHQMDIFIEAMNTSKLGLYHVDLRTAQGAIEAIDIIGDALIKVSEQRTELGAYQNRLEHTIQNLENVVENTTASESQIRDSDMAKLMVEYSNNQILLQAGQVMMAQANRSRELVLGLLQM